MQPEERHVEQQRSLIVIYAHNSSINNNNNINIILNNSKREYQIVSPLKRIVKTRLIVSNQSHFGSILNTLLALFPFKDVFSQFMFIIFMTINVLKTNEN